MNFAAELDRRLAALEGEVRRLRAGLVRVGTIESVDTAKGVVRVQYPSGITSAPMPWFQRGSEHRPPRAGEHAVILDPSLQGTSAIAIAGHPSEVHPPASGGGDQQVLHHDSSGDADTYQNGTRTIAVRTLHAKVERARLEANDVRLGPDPTDFAALASRVDGYVRALDNAFRTWVPVAQDGGAALKAKFLAAFPTLPASVAASHVRIK